MKTPNEQQRNLMHERGFMLATEAATISGWHLSWVHRQVQRAKLTGEKVGATWYVRRVSLALALGRTVVTSSAPFLTAEELVEVEEAWTRGAVERAGDLPLRASATLEATPPSPKAKKGAQRPEQRPVSGGTGQRPSKAKKPPARAVKGRAARPSAKPAARSRGAA